MNVPATKATPTTHRLNLRRHFWAPSLVMAALALAPVWNVSADADPPEVTETSVAPEPAANAIRLGFEKELAARVYRPDFSPLRPQVIAVDGMYTRRPLAMQGFDLAPGNRLDLDLIIPSDAVGQTFSVVDRLPRQPFTLATLQVKGTPIETPTFAAPTNPNIPAWVSASEQDVDATYVLNAQAGGPHGIQWTINGRPWGEHEVTQLNEGRWVRIRFQNDSARLHPMHIHGQFFKVLSRNGQPADEPYFRDTVLLYGRETLDVGMVPIDWGRWMMHCHILEHAEAGMMTEIRVGDP